MATSTGTRSPSPKPTGRRCRSFYEGRTTDAAVKGASKMDDLFYRWFFDLTDDQRKTLQQRYATTAKVLEAPELIAAKAKDILRHYISTVMPDGFKGMIVATSREACLRYYQALNTARDELVAELDQHQPHLANGSGGSYDLDESFMTRHCGPGRSDPRPQVRAGHIRRPQRPATLHTVDRQAPPRAAY